MPRPLRTMTALCLAALVGCGGGAAGTTPTPDAALPDDVATDVATRDAQGDAVNPPDDTVNAPDDVVNVPDDTGPAVGPVAAPRDTWTWVDEPGTRCANGRPTGFGVNLADDATRVLIFLQGGGACWDDTTCLGLVPTSFYVQTGYGAVEFATDVLRPAMLPLRRNDPANPFRAMSMVYVPYCTGDIHGGDRVTRYNGLGRSAEFHHVGARNLDRILRRVAATFPRARRVWLAGDSAGGFGAALNMDRVQRALPLARVDVLNDSGQPVQPPADRWRAMRTAWNLQLPEGCDAACGDDLGAMTVLLRQRYPNNRFGLVSFTHDPVISTFMGLDAFTFNARLRDFTRTMARDWPAGRYFLLPGASHVAFVTPTPGLVRWMQAMVSDDPAWANVD